MNAGSFEDQPIRIPIKDRRTVRDDHEEVVSAEAPEGPRPDQDVPESDSNGLSAAKAQAAAYLEDLQRLKAEFENYRKRMLKEQTAFAETASVLVVQRLLGVLDALSLAIDSAAEARDFDVMLKGVEMAFGEMSDVLQTEGLETISPTGAMFDPNLHDAAVEVPGDDSGVLVVEEVLRPGYIFKGRVLRPAMVKVTQRGEPQEEG